MVSVCGAVGVPSRSVRIAMGDKARCAPARSAKVGPDMARLLLVRHGESTWNAARRWQGWADPPLSPLGREQAIEAAARLDGVGTGRVVSSDLRRAIETAELLAPGATVEVAPGLRERNVGDWSGLTRDEIEARWPGMIDAWQHGRITRIPGGEENAEFTARVVAALVDVAADVDARGDDRPVLVVAHGGVIR